MTDDPKFMQISESSKHLPSCLEAYRSCSPDVPWPPLALSHSEAPRPLQNTVPNAPLGDGDVLMASVEQNDVQLEMS